MTFDPYGTQAAFAMTTVESHFTPGQIARQAVIDHILSTTKSPYRFNVTVAADWVMHGGPSSYVDTLVEESGSGLIEEIYETLSEAAEQINEPEPELDYGRAVLQFIPGDWSDEATAAPINEFDHLIKNQTDRGNWIALDINPDDFKPVDYSRIAVVPSGSRDGKDCICTAVGVLDVRLDDRDFFCLIEVNPDDFKPVEDRPFEKGDRVIAVRDTTLQAGSVLGGTVGTVVSPGSEVPTNFVDGQFAWVNVKWDAPSIGWTTKRRDIAHVAAESSNYTKAADLVNA